MSLSELELFEHATNLGSERPDGMRYGGGGRGSGKASATNFTLKLRSSHNKFWQATGKDR